MRPFRMEALADAIFAIVMTLLVLELKVPEVAHGVFHADDFMIALFGLWPKFVAYVVSFWLLAFYWNSHHLMFGYLDTMDFKFVWRNFVFLMFIGLIPFSTALLGQEPFLQISQIIYALNLILCGVIVFGLWHYVIHNEHISGKDRAFSNVLRRNVRGKILLPPLLYAIGIGVTFISTTWSLVFFALGPIIYFIDIDHPLWQFIASPLAPKKR